MPFGLVLLGSHCFLQFSSAVLIVVFSWVLQAVFCLLHVNRRLISASGHCQQPSAFQVQMQTNHKPVPLAASAPIPSGALYCRSGRCLAGVAFSV